MNGWLGVILLAAGLCNSLTGSGAGQGCQGGGGVSFGGPEIITAYQFKWKGLYSLNDPYSSASEHQLITTYIVIL